METIYSPDLKAHLTIDDENRVRHILQTQEYFLSEKSNARLAAADYLTRRADTFRIPLVHLERLHLKTSFLDPRAQEIEYREYEIKKSFASTTHCYYQTIHNVPVWLGGTTVTVKENPFRITHADHYGHDPLDLELPSRDVIRRIRTILIRINTQAAALGSGLTGHWSRLRSRLVGLETIFAPTTGTAEKGTFGRTSPWVKKAKATRGLFYVYRYTSGERISKNAHNFLEYSRKRTDLETEDCALTLPLPRMPRRIRDNEHYLVAEIIFHLAAKPHLNWRALLEVETGAILWLRAMACGVNGLVFEYDPQTSTGNLNNTPDDGNVILNPLRDDVPLVNLEASVGGIQSLDGRHVAVVDDDAPTIVPPTETTGTDFDYDARTNDFAAVNAYYHGNGVFDVIEDLGFVLNSYFDGTTFPVHLDHRASWLHPLGLERGALCIGNATGNGIGLVAYMLSDLTDTANPLGRSVDKWVHWHEIGGHGILLDHVRSLNFGFAHSAGDALAAFQNDPVSKLRPLPERFEYAPFRGLSRWFNRAVSDGWGWGGALDTGSYSSEQILATTLFRVYRALGGDAVNEPNRWLASRVATYLVLNAVSHCSPVCNPPTAVAFYNKLKAADDDDWTSAGYAGGAYHKVIRWAFEKQGLWRAPGAASTDIGAPPAVDLYIDDGRGGEYPYQAVHWNCPSVWNRTAADGGTTPQPAAAGVPSFAYVKVKNRGTTGASGTVKVYHCLPGAGLTWPTDFVQAGPIAGLPTGNVQANDGNEVVVGPFAWTPNVNAYGHDCLLAMVHAEGDPSNVDNLEPGQTIQEWRLVPHDNNVGQRNVHLVPGGSGEALTQAMGRAMFFARNNLNKPASMQLRADLPRVLAVRDWRLEFPGIDDNQFHLLAGESRKIVLRLVRGADFDAREIRASADPTFTVYLYGNGLLLGGMTYQMDPDSAELMKGRRKLDPQFE